MAYQELTDLQWQVIEPLFPNPIKRGRGKPHTEWRRVLNAILYILSSRSKWDALPKLPEFASKSAAHRWYKTWEQNGFLDQILTKLKELSMLASEIQLPATRTPRVEQAPLVSPS